MQITPLSGSVLSANQQVKGDKFEFDAEANKEYALEIALVPSRGGFFLFGMAGAMSMGTFKLTLKETKPLLLSPV